MDATVLGIINSSTKILGSIVSAALSNITFSNPFIKKDKIKDVFTKIIDDVVNDTFTKCQNTNIDDMKNDEFCERIFIIGLNNENVNILIDGIEKGLQGQKKEILKNLVTSQSLDNEIEKLETQKTENSKIENDTTQSKEIANIQKNIDLLKDEKVKLSTDVYNIQKVKNTNEKEMKKLNEEAANKDEKISKIDEQIDKLNTELDKKILDLKNKKEKIKSLTVKCKDSSDDIVTDYEKIFYYINMRLNKLKKNYEEYYNSKNQKISTCQTIDINEYCKTPENTEYKKEIIECNKMYNTYQTSLNQEQINKKKDFAMFQNYCSVDIFKKDNLITDIKINLRIVFNNYKIISSECKEPKCILNLMKTYKTEFTAFNTYITKKFNGEEYKPEAINKIREMLNFNVDSASESDTNINNFFNNNDIKENNLQNLKDVNYMVVFDINQFLLVWKDETTRLLQKIQETKTMKEKQEQNKMEDLKKQEEKEKLRQYEAKNEREILDKREREKEKRIEQERSRQREHEKYLESLKKNSSSSSVLNENSSKSNAVGILVFTASAVLLGGVGIAFASK